jgi:uncharacterized protein (UPF0332 family)
VTPDPELVAQLRQICGKADRALAAASEHIEAGDYDFAVSRAYYAVFYSLEAALLTRGLVFPKHSGVIAGFNQHFVRAGVFPREFSKMIASLFRERQIGDYEFDVSVSREDAIQGMRDAQTLVAAAREYLEREGYIS